MLSLAELVQETRAKGYAVTDGGLGRLKQEASILKWRSAPSRAGNPSIEMLRPTSEDEADTKSLSAVYGQGAQPLHTDGAHQYEPPDVVLLSSDGPSGVGTRLYRVGKAEFSGAMFNDLRCAVYTVRAGQAAFLAHALDFQNIASWRLRFDLGCMTPAEPRAKRVADYFARKRDDAVRFDWAEPGLVLAIDNRKTPHARDDVVGEPRRLMRRLALRIEGGQSLLRTTMWRFG